MKWFQSTTAAPKPPRNINIAKQQKTWWEKLIRARTDKNVGVFLMCRELVQVVMATAGEVGLQNFPK